MAFRIDDDENRIQDLKDQIDQLEIQTFSPEVVARNESTRNTGVQTGDSAATNAYPQWMPIRDFGDVGLVSQEILLNRVDSHVAKMRIVGNVDFSFEEPPGTNKMMEFILDVTVDGVGGYTINLPANILPVGITIDNTANARTVIRFTTTDAGVTYYAEDISGTSGGNVPDGTAQFQHLQWDGIAWIAQQELQFGANFANAGQIQLSNDQIGMAWRNVANNGNIEVKTTSTDILDITNSANDSVILSLRAQDASFADILSSWSQESNVGGLGGTTTFTYPTEMAFNHGATLVALFASDDEINFFNNIDVNINDIIKVDRLQLSGGTTSATSVNDVVWYLSSVGDLVSNINATDGWIWSSGNIIKMILTDSTLEKRNVTAPVFQLYNTRAPQTGNAGSINILANSVDNLTGVPMGFIIADTEIELGDGSGSLKFGVNFNGISTSFMSLNDNNNGQVDILKETDFNSQDVRDINRLHLAGGTASALGVDDVSWYLTSNDDLISNIGAGSEWGWSSDNIIKMILTDSTLEKRNVTAPIFQLYNTRTAQTGTAGVINILANTVGIPTGIPMGFIISDTEVETGNGSGSISFGVNLNGIPTSFIKINDNNDGNVKLFSNLDLGGNFIQLEEITLPTDPAVNTGLIYLRDNGGITTPFFLDSAGTETSLLVEGGGTSFIGFFADANLEMFEFSILDALDIRFSVDLVAYSVPSNNVGIGYDPVPNSMKFNVPLGSDYTFTSGGADFGIIIDPITGINLISRAISGVTNLSMNSPTATISGINRLNFNGSEATITGIADIDFFESDQTIGSFPSGLFFSIADTQAFEFTIDTDMVLKIEEPSANVFQLNMLNHSIVNSTAIAIVDTGGVDRGSISGDAISTAMRVSLPTNGKFIISEVLTDIVSVDDTTGITMLGTHVLRMSNNTINTIRTIEFQGNTHTPSGQTGMGFDSDTLAMKYNVGLISHIHQFQANGEFLASFSRVGSNEGLLTTHAVTATSIQVLETILLSTFTNSTPTNGEIWRDSSSGLFQFQQNGVTVGLAGGGGSGNSISEGNSSATILDIGTGRFEVNLDGEINLRLANNYLQLFPTTGIKIATQSVGGTSLFINVTVLDGAIFNLDDNSVDYLWQISGTEKLKLSTTIFKLNGVDLEMDGNSIILDTNGTTSIDGFQTDRIQFNINSSLKMSIDDIGLDMAVDLKMFENDIILDGGGGSIISGTPGVMDLKTTGSTRMEITNSVVSMSVDLEMLGNDITSVDDITFSGSGSLINLNGGDMTNFDTLQAQGSGSEILMIGGEIGMGQGDIRMDTNGNGNGGNIYMEEGQIIDVDEITFHGNSRMLADGSTEYGIQLDDASANVGTAGMLAMPQARPLTVPTKAELDGFYGTHKGAMGIDTGLLPHLYVRSINGDWFRFDVIVTITV